MRKNHYRAIVANSGLCQVSSTVATFAVGIYVAGQVQYDNTALTPVNNSRVYIKTGTYRR